MDSRIAFPNPKAEWGGDPPKVAQQGTANGFKPV
jgi:hypothetical protein